MSAHLFKHGGYRRLKIFQIAQLNYTSVHFVHFSPPQFPPSKNN